MVRRVPIDSFPFYVVGAQDLVRHALDFCLRCGRRLAFVFFRRDLDIDPHAAVPLGNDHAGATRRADRALDLNFI